MKTNQQKARAWAKSCPPEELVGMAWIAEQKRDERGDDQTDRLLYAYAEIAAARGFEVLTPTEGETK